MSKSSKKKSQSAAPQKHHTQQAGQDLSDLNKPEVVKPASIFKHYKESIKDHVEELKVSFKNDLDPQKMENLRQELKKILKNGAVWTTGIFAITAIIIVIELHSHERIMPRTKVGNIEIGYMKAEETKTKILAEAEKYLKTPIVFSYEGQEITLSPEELGIQLSIDQTLNTIPVLSFEKENPAVLIASLIIPRDLTIQSTIDVDRIIYLLEEKFLLKEKRAKNAHFVLKDNEFHIEPEAPGMAINRTKLIAALRKNNKELTMNPIDLQIEPEQPRITAEALSREKDHLLGLIQKPITVKSGNKTLTLKLSDHLNAVQFTESDTLSFKNTKVSLPLVMGNNKITITENSPVQLHSGLRIKLIWENLLPYLEKELIAGLEIQTSPVKIYTEADGKIVIEGKGENGRSVPRNRLMESVVLAANNSISEIEIPIYEEKAPITISDDLKDLGIQELLATGHSSYYGSPTNRMFNIAHGIQRFNGVLIKPGEEFSFNTQLGPVDGAHGYKLEKVIKENKAEYEMGGGICQVSTTAYRAALLAGLPVTVRREHTWKVSYYGQTMGHGLDATIYLGGQDLKFINDTPSAIVMQAYIEDSNAYFKFYGTNDGRTIAMDGPYGGGLSWKWYRTINKDGAATKETITSNYHPIPPPDPKPAPPPKPIAQKPPGNVPTI